MLDKARPTVEPFIQKAAKPLSFLHPNIITLIGFFSGILFYILMANQMYGWAVLSFIGIAFDSLDGTIARMTGTESKFGAFFDSSLDRITDAVVILGFAAAGVVGWPLAAFTLLASLMISYVRGTAEKVSGNKIRLAVGIMERPERLIMLFVAALLVYFEVDWMVAGWSIVEVVFLLLLGLSVVTVVQRMYAAWKVL